MIPKEQLSRLRIFLQDSALSHQGSERKWFADQILAVFRHRLEDFLGENEVGECIQFLVQSGFFHSESFSKQEQLMLREKLFSLLSLMTSDSLRSWSQFSVIAIARNEKSHDRVVKLDSQIKKLRKTAIKSMNTLSAMVCSSSYKLTKTDENESQQIRGMETLFALALLQLYNGDTEAVSVLQVINPY